ncbi:MAG: replicative DNA helicase [Lachnospiraceae bacterium]|nr:replicative DNA helicase [Lachnospiraceae bacterium]MBR6256885.1 replicative DNA helicase [Lachnospiraceae bacterium]
MADGAAAPARRVKPNNKKAEEAVIGGLYIDNKEIGAVRDLLPDGSYFYNELYGHIYDAILELGKKGSAIDVLTLGEMLREKGVPEEVVSEQFIMDIIDSVPTSANVKHYAKIVSDKALMRDLLRVTEDISEDCYKDSDDVNDLLEKTEKSVFKVVQRRSVGRITPTADIVMRSLESIDKAARATGSITGLPTGFTDLDHKTAGLQAGNLVLVAARPAMGKTSLVLSILQNIVVKQKKAALMFSLEMSENELMNRLLSMDSGVDSQKFKTGQLSDADWELLTESGGNLANSRLFLNDSATTLSEISSISRKIKAENNLELIVIDYLQLMNSSGKRNDGRQQEISEISRGLKLLAKELGIPIIALSQLSRGVESRTDHRPVLSDLRESGAIEQDADIVMFIYRDEVYNSDSEDKGIAEIIIAKHRSGPIGTVKLVWIPEFTQFKNMEYR